MFSRAFHMTSCRSPPTFRVTRGLTALLRAMMKGSGGLGGPSPNEGDVMDLYIESALSPTGWTVRTPSSSIQSLSNDILDNFRFVSSMWQAMRSSRWLTFVLKASRVDCSELTWLAKGKRPWMSAMSSSVFFSKFMVLKSWFVDISADIWSKLDTATRPFAPGILFADIFNTSKHTVLVLKHRNKQFRYSNHHHHRTHAPNVLRYYLERHFGGEEALYYTVLVFNCACTVRQRFALGRVKLDRKLKWRKIYI